MLLRSIKVERWRCFVAPLALRGIGERLTIVHGPNGSGKSTLMQALRFAFFESHRATGEAVRRLLPWGHADAPIGPSVTVEFELDGRRLRVRKRWLRRAESVLKEWNGSRFLEIANGTEADERVRAMLLGTRPARGLTRMEHLGLARILWTTTQGRLDVDLSSDSDRPLLERLRRAVAVPAVYDLSPVEAALGKETSRLFRSDGQYRAGARVAQLDAELAEQERALAEAREQLARVEHVIREAQDAEHAVEAARRPNNAPAGGQQAADARPRLTAAWQALAAAHRLEEIEQATSEGPAEAVRAAVARTRARLDAARETLQAAVDATLAEARAGGAEPHLPTNRAGTPAAAGRPTDDLEDALRTLQHARGRLHQLMADMECGGEGPYERVTRLAEAVRALQDEREREARRAEAHRLLHELVSECRAEWMDGVAGPVEEAVTATLRQLGFAHGDKPLTVAPTLAVKGLAVGEAGRLAGVDELSQGEREQLFLALRLALARRLAAPDGGGEASRQLVLFDDALTATDSPRFARILSLLEDASRADLQVVVFTCHPERYADLSAVRIDLAAARAVGDVTP